MLAISDLDLVENDLKRAVASDVDMLCTTGQHVACWGGKRLRPQVVLLSYQAVGGRDTYLARPLAVAVELLHTASLIHDDIVDLSDTRRGQATVNARWGDSMALLSGDFVFVKLLDLIADCDSRVLRVLATCCVDIVEGETLQALHFQDTAMSEVDYLEIVSQKTASLFMACAELGALQGGGSERQITALAQYGFNLGVAFQIRDDTLDLVGSKATLGKPVGSDLKQGKMCSATLFALQQAPEEARAILSCGDTARAARWLRDLGAIDYAMGQVGHFAAVARDALSTLPPSEAKASLCELTEFVQQFPS